MKKKLTVAKTIEKLAKLRQKLNDLNEEILTLGKTTIRDGKVVGSMDTNYIVYNIAMFRTMLNEVENIAGDDTKLRETLIEASIGEDVDKKIERMTAYLKLSVKFDDLSIRHSKLENYLDAIPKEEMDAYKLKKAAGEVDERDLDDEAND
jgi:hypothetical protein